MPVRTGKHLHFNEKVACIFVGSKQLNIEGGVCVVRTFPVEHVHLHLIVVAFESETNNISVRPSTEPYAVELTPAAAAVKHNRKIRNYN